MVKFKKGGSIKFKNLFKQLAVPFKIYAAFKKQKNISITFLASLLIKSFVLMINSVKKLFSKEERMKFIDLLKQLLKSMIIAKKKKKMIKKHFNKNLIMSSEDEERFQLSNN